jgi:hypothetical protein
VGALLSAVFMPVDGKSSAIVGLVAAGYAFFALCYWLLSRQPAGGPSGARPESSPSRAAQASSS